MQEAQERAALIQRRQEVERRGREFAAKRAAAERQIAETRAALDAEEAEIRTLTGQAGEREEAMERDRAVVAAIRGAAE